TMRKLVIADCRNHLPARVQIASLAQGDQLLDDRPQLLCLRQSRHNLLVFDKGCRHIGKHRLAMARSAIQLAAGITMAHSPSPSINSPEALSAFERRQAATAFAFSVRPNQERSQRALDRATDIPIQRINY